MKLMMQVDLTTGWRFRQAGKGYFLPAAVPGCIHTDLLAAGMISDPFYGDNETRLQWPGERAWEYELKFDAPSALLERAKQAEPSLKTRIALVFEGLDTFAEVSLNGEVLGNTDNMHRTWTFDVSDRLAVGQNTLRVHFSSVFEKAREPMKALPYKLTQFSNNDQADVMVGTYVRKAAYHFGWDWGPRLVTAGIWRPVRLELRQESRLAAAQVSTRRLQDEGALLCARFDLEGSLDEGLELIVREESGAELARTTVRNASRPAAGPDGLASFEMDFWLERPRLWWCNGLGDAHLYRFDLCLEQGGRELDRRTVRCGVRTVALEQRDDASGRSFVLHLNGVPVFAKGANWIPADSFANRVTASRYRDLIGAARDANMNMLRLWGGGYFESDQFYEICDELGIMVWHDMLFACGTYPGTAAFTESVRAEIRDNLLRIRNHPSIVLWCGNNEVEVAYYQCGFKQKLEPRHQAEHENAMWHLFREAIPAAISAVDHSRPYHPTSPDTGYNNIPLSMGDVHYWDVWHGKQPFSAYQDHVGRFMSEYGFQSYPVYKSVEGFIPLAERKAGSRLLQAHQRCMSDNRRDKAYGDRLIRHYLAQHYPDPRNLEDYVYLSQLLQAKAMQTAAEAHRRRRGFCMGSLYWQHNDCWPAISWSGIDWYGRWKALHYRARRFFAPLLLSFEQSADRVACHVVSDLREPVRGLLDLALLGFDGRVLVREQLRLDVPPFSAAVVHQQELKTLLDIARTAGLSGTSLCLRAQLFAEAREQTEAIADAYHYFVPEKDMTFAPPGFEMMLDGSSRQWTLKLSCRSLAKDVWLECSDCEAQFSDNAFDLPPGEVRRIEVKLDRELPASPRILIRSLGQMQAAR